MRSMSTRNAREATTCTGAGVGGGSDFGFNFHCSLNGSNQGIDFPLRLRGRHGQLDIRGQSASAEITQSIGRRAARRCKAT